MATIVDEKAEFERAKSNDWQWAESAKAMLALIGTGSVLASVVCMMLGGPVGFVGAGLFAIAAAISWGILFRTLERR